MTTDTTLESLYWNACRDDARLLAQVDATDLVELAQGRLAGERRQRVVEAIAASPSLAAAYRMAKAGGEWAQGVSAELKAGSVAPSVVRALPLRRNAPAARRFAMAAAVSAMAIGAVFVGSRMESPGVVDSDFAAMSGQRVHEDAILAASFGPRDDADVIFSSRSDAESDRIFAFGKGS